MGSNRIDYPSIDVVGWDLHDRISKDMYMSLAVDFARQLFGEDRTDDEIRALLAERLDILESNGIVPRTLPKRFPRPAART